MFGVIYKISNNFNDKIYVGQTQRSIQERFQEHAHSKSLLGRAIRKHGKDNFIIEIIEECNTLEQLNEREIFWISKLNCISPNGYNLTGGGKGHLRMQYSEETRKKISIANKKHGNGREGIKHSEETRKKISASLMGHSFSEETKSKISKTLTGRKGHTKTADERQKISNGLKNYWAQKKFSNNQ